MNAPTPDQMALAAIHQVLDNADEETNIPNEAADSMYRTPECVLTRDMCANFVNQAIDTARVTTTDGNLTDASTMLINGNEVSVLPYCGVPAHWSSFAACRWVLDAIREAGYRRVGYLRQVSPEFCEVPVVRQLPTT